MTSRMLNPGGATLLLQGQPSSLSAGVIKVQVQPCPPEVAIRCVPSHQRQILALAGGAEASRARTPWLQSLPSRKHPFLAQRHQAQPRRVGWRAQMAPLADGDRSGGPDHPPSEESTNSSSPIGQDLAIIHGETSVTPEDAKETLASVTQALQEVSQEVQATGGRQLALRAWEHVRQAATEGGAAWWRTAKPWYKWPVAIFIPWFLLLRLFFGAVVVRDLLPLWILGPVCLGAAIQLTIATTKAAIAAALITVAATKNAAAKSVELAEYSRSGQLAQDVRALATTTRQRLEAKRSEVLQLASGRKDALVVYVGSGQLTQDAKEKAKNFVEDRAARLTQWAVLKSEDLIDWWRPNSRKFKRLVQIIF